MIGLFAGLALMNLASVLAAVMLAHRLVGTFEDSVETNRQWADRAANFAALARIATEANAPGNDVFDSRDVERERARLQRTLREYDSKEREVRADLAMLDPGDASRLAGVLDAAHRSLDDMAAEAGAIFDAFDRDDEAEAGRHMASMDRKLAHTGHELSRVAAGARRLQNDAFAVQSRAAAALGRIAWMLVGAVALLVVFALLYGRALARSLSAAQAAIEERNGDMRRLLDYASQGFATLDLRETLGRLSLERSRAFDLMLGTSADGKTLQDVLGERSSAAADWARLGLEAIRDGFMPLEVSLEQMPRRVVVDGRSVRLSYRPVGPTDAPDALLVVTSDVTAEEERERMEEEARETAELFGRVMSDRDGIIEMLSEASMLVRSLSEAKGSIELERRRLHTLKGTTALFGLVRFSRLCHEVESAAVDRSDRIDEREMRELSAAWDRAVAQLRLLLGDRREQLIEVDEREHALIVDAVLTNAPAEEVATRLAGWRLERSKRRLERVGEMACALARRLGKENLVVAIEANDVRMNRERWAGFWSEISHVIRNAVDHGIESADERIAIGKPAEGQLTVCTRVEGDRLCVEVRDDGRGIDWAAVRTRARKLAMPFETHEDLVEALFTDGVSTRDDVTETSGRGVGLAAVRQAVVSLGGRIEVATTEGGGTTFRFVLPYADVEHALRSVTERHPRLAA